MDIPEQYCVYETEHWLVNHRMNAALPGYLILGSKAATSDLSGMPEEALISLGPLLASVHSAVQAVLSPERIYIGRYGHTPGWPLHFHLVPIFDWVERLFWEDGRYRALGDFSTPPGANGTDGAELTLFVWREFCERSDPPENQGPTVEQSITLIRAELIKKARV